MSPLPASKNTDRPRSEPWPVFFPPRLLGGLQSIGDVGAFQAIRRNVITPGGSVELAAVAEMSAAGFRVARVAPLLGRPIVDADAASGAAPVVVIGHDVWQRRFGGAPDVIGRELPLGEAVHTVIGVMPDGFQFPMNFRYWVPLHRRADGAITIGAVTGSVLLLSAAGLYALTAFTVAQRRREIGIRSALGAHPGHLVATVFRRAFWQIGAGAAAGMLAAWLVGRHVPIEQVGGLPALWQGKGEGDVKALSRPRGS